jgi:hypothetical protein
VRALALALAVVLAVGASEIASTGAARSAPRILFGLGPEADGARGGGLVKAAPVRMLSSWYNGPADLGWMSSWRHTEIPRDYAAGYALHLIVWSGGPQTEVSTRYGAGCGQGYPLSAQFLRDMTRLARIFSGRPADRLFVTLFSEFQTYACNGNDWGADPQTTAYFRALKDQYRAALGIFHRLAPNGAVSLGWGGWQTRWDDPARGGGRSLFKYFADVMNESDFQSFEVINSSSDASDILTMTRELGRFGPVMLAYYKPAGEGGATASTHLKAVLSRSFLLRIGRARLFAMSFMDDRFMRADPFSLAIVSEAVRKYGCRKCGPRP